MSNTFKQTASAVNAVGKMMKNTDSRKNSVDYGSMNNVQETAHAKESRAGSSKPKP